MKRWIAIMLCAVVLMSLLTGCGSRPPAESDSSAAEKQESHYVFQPYVYSSFLREIMGDTMKEAYNSLVDAVLAGEDTFACPDEETYSWVMGQIPYLCFPVIGEYVKEEYDHPVINGRGRIRYTIPKEEVAQKIRDFEAEIQRILNEALDDDDTDFEKALKLYVYVAQHYTYDYGALSQIADASLSAYRFFYEKKGICQEVSVAYSYLLMQVGLDATVMKGVRSSDGENHQWSYWNYNGHNYHIDPTYALGQDVSLSYFMMTDSQREAEDGYLRKDYIPTTVYAQFHPYPAYEASDDRFAGLWGNTFVSLNKKEKTVVSVSSDDGESMHYFSYR